MNDLNLEEMASFIREKMNEMKNFESPLLPNDDVFISAREIKTEKNDKNKKQE